MTSASICTDYQTRRLGTRLRDDLTGGSAGGTKLGFPHTVNGTAMAVPRVLACLLENGWDEETGTVVVPEALRGYLLGGLERIGPKGKKKKKGRGVKHYATIGTKDLYQNMVKIFTRSGSVFVWLDPASEDSDLAFHFLRRLSETWDVISPRGGDRYSRLGALARMRATTTVY